MERETGIEPALVAWKATVLPLNYSRRRLPGIASTRMVRPDGLIAHHVQMMVEGGGFEPPKA